MSANIAFTVCIAHDSDKYVIFNTVSIYNYGFVKMTHSNHICSKSLNHTEFKTIGRKQEKVTVGSTVARAAIADLATVLPTLMFHKLYQEFIVSTQSVKLFRV